VWVLLVGLVFGVPASVRAVQVFLKSINGPALNVPGSTQVHLNSGRWVIFQRTGSKSDYGPVHTSENGPPTITVSDVTVIGAGGALQVRELTGTQTITSGSTIYTGAVEFSVPSDDEYTISVASARPVEAMVTRSFSDVVGAFAPWAVVAIAGNLLALLGLIFVLAPAPKPGTVTLIHPPRTTTPAGWYPDPAISARSRWWDGYRWTDHTTDRNQ